MKTGRNGAPVQAQLEIREIAIDTELLCLAFNAGGYSNRNIYRSLMGAEAEVRGGAVTYMQIRLLGGPALLGMMTAFGALHGAHDMRTPLWIAAGSNALNAGLDALLIAGASPIPAFGIAGAAWASVVAQWVGVVFAVAAVARKVGLPRRQAFMTRS